MTVALVVVAVVLLLPGLGASLAVASPGGISIQARIALAFCLGYAVVAAVATVLALAHIFTRPVFIAALVLATAGAWAAALRRASFREHGSALAAQIREAPFIFATGVALLAVVAVSRLFYPEANSLAVRSSWRYWADGLEVADAGHVPGLSAQWGTEIPTTVSKMVFNAFQGGVSFLAGAGPLAPMNAIMAFTAVAFVAALLALGRELGLGIFAPLVPVLTALVPDSLPYAREIASELRVYTAEDVGRMAAIGALLVGMYAVRAGRGRGLGVVTGILFAVAGLTHLVPTLIGGVLLALYALARLILNRGDLRRVLALGLVTTAVFGASYVGALAASGGDLGLQRATSGAAFEEFPQNVDPTRSFTHGSYLKRVPVKGDFLIAPREILRRYGADAIDHPNAGRYGLLILAFLAAATAAMVLTSRRFLSLAVMAWGLAAISLAVAFLFSFRYETVIPANFGVRRLYDYVALVPALIVPALLETVSRPLSRQRAVPAALTVAVGVLAIVVAIDRVPADRSPSSAAAGVEVFERVAEVVPCEARMIANSRTAGSWQAWTGRRAITEGMSPFLRPRIMEQVLPTLVSANDFFDDPQTNRGFLERQDVDYLVVVNPSVWFGWGGTGRAPKADDAVKIAALPNVELVSRDENVSIFAIGGANADRAGGQPRRCTL